MNRNNIQVDITRVDCTGCLCSRCIRPCDSCIKCSDDKNKVGVISACADFMPSELEGIVNNEDTM